MPQRRDMLLNSMTHGIDIALSLRKGQSKFPTNVAVSRLVTETSAEADSSLTMTIYEPNAVIFLSLVHIAIKIRTDIIDMSGHEGLKVSETHAHSCVPDSLYMLLQLLFGGEQLFEYEKRDGKEAEVRRKVVSCAQDTG